MNYTRNILNRYTEALRDASDQGCVPLNTVRFALSMALADVEAIISGQADTLTRQAEKIARLEAENEQLMALPKFVKVDAADEVDYPLIGTIEGNGANSAAGTPNPNGFVTQTGGLSWHGLPRDLQAQITRMEDGEVIWRQLPMPDRRAIALYVLPKVGSNAMSMAQFDGSRPQWMPTASALSQMFGLRWTELVEQANKVAEA